MWEHPRLWRELEGLISDVTSYVKRDKIDEKQWLPEAINAMKDGAGDSKQCFCVDAVRGDVTATR